MSTLPESWVNLQLKEVAEIITGSTPSTKNPEYYGGDIPFIKPGDLDTQKPLIQATQYLSTEGAKKSRLVRKGASLVSCIGNLGKVGYSGKAVATNQQINSVEFEENLVDDRFGFYQLRTLKNWMEQEASATTISILNKSKFSEAPILLAPLKEQRRIADKLDTTLARVDALNDRLARITPLLKRFRQSVLAAATSGRLTEDLNSPTYSFAPLCELADRRLGKMLDKGKNSGQSVKYLRNVNVRWFSFELDDLLEMKVEAHELDNLSINDGDVLICEGGEPGRCAIWKNGNNNFVFQKALHRVRTNKSKLLPEWLVINLKHQADSGVLEELFTGTTIKHLTGSSLAKLLIPLPTIEQQTEIVRRVETLFAFADRLEARLQSAQTAAERLTPALLTKAFRGELVPQDPNDEPATELLRRLREARAAEAPTKPKRGRKAAAA